MTSFYERIGAILRDRLNSDEDPFDQWDNRGGKYRTCAGRMERRPPPKKNPPPGPVRVPVPPELVEDFAVLSVPAGPPLSYCKQSWKRLLKKYHPDVFTCTHTSEQAADIVRRINSSYKRIETWFETGALPTDNKS